MRVNASTQNNNSSSLTTFSYSMYVSVYICGDEEYTFNVIGYNINIKSSFIRLSYVVIFDRSEWVILANTRVCICTVRKTSYLSYICGSQNWFINSKKQFSNVHHNIYHHLIDSICENTIHRIIQTPNTL